MRKRLKAAAAAMAVLLLLTGCGELSDPSQYTADHGIYITGSGSYDVDGEFKLKSVVDGEDGKKQLTFSLSTDSAVGELYIFPLKDGVSVGGVTLSGTNGEISYELLTDKFTELNRISGAYGWKTEKDSDSITAKDAASKLLFLVKKGKAVDKYAAATGDDMDGYDGYTVSLWVGYQWSSTDYDDLVYIGFNEAAKGE